MAVKYALVAILAIAVTTFALQNTAPTSVRFHVWTLNAVPLAGVVLLAVAAGGWCSPARRCASRGCGIALACARSRPV